ANCQRRDGMNRAPTELHHQSGRRIWRFRCSSATLPLLRPPNLLKTLAKSADRGRIADLLRIVAVKLVAQGLSAAIVAAGLVCSAAGAQELGPYVDSSSSFDGFYAGVMAGPMSARMGNFFADPEDFYYQLGAVAGWN